MNGVKREVESPKEEQKKEVVQEEVVISKVETTNIEEKVEKVTITIQETKVEAPIEPLKTEKNDSQPLIPKEAVIEPQPIVEPLEPCVKTVAENVKVKNMKRKPSITNNTIKEEPSAKKPKLEKGSYKDLIKKSYTAVQINNGKKKLLSRNLVQKLSKIRLKKPQTKRKLSPTKEVDAKKMKPSKPFAVSNHQSKVSSKEAKTFTDADLIENKEPTQKKGKKSNLTPMKSKKNAAVVLDNLLARNSVDRTIESVISDNSGNARTKNGASNGAVLRTLSEKCGGQKIKTEVRKETVNGKKNSNGNGKCVVVKSKSSECKKAGAAKRKTKSKSIEVAVQVVPKVPRRSLPLPKWSNGWEWKGEPFDGRVFLNVSFIFLVLPYFFSFQKNFPQYNQPFI